ncbi:ATP-dependent RNA helicase HrpA [Eikenella corrodens]|uniref:ATP-dependent RNA helicase HrpA n=1 Tax=Eikenella corrodens TaxID=539 RepID=A0A3S9SH40_EIKCO|nr:ATP-dependent RNA helicase HrpA [Eikenella corrodens]AZR58823.1 ATP-dependent RNA helicase HrpA [Eikenella corrodens]
MDLSQTLSKDRHFLQSAFKNPNKYGGLSKVEEKYRKSHEIFLKRLAALPKPEFDNTLPVHEKLDEIKKTIAENQVTIICGETGSGKTTQLPKICLELGRGAAGLIGHTQPRRLAACSVAERIAEELKSEIGSAVGYKVRFTDHTSRDACVKLMTDGILLAETQTDRYLAAYDTIIIDEAHERSLNIDFLLGYLKQLLPRRPDLKVIITSATIDAERFSQHFNGAPVLEVSGRTYPVEILYHPLTSKDEDDAEVELTDAIVDAADELARHGEGDILVFLPGEREIREAAEALRKSTLRRNDEILPLFARLSHAEQHKIFHPSGAKRRIVLATNVAETSLTVPGIKYVIDTGLARVKRYSARAKVEQLHVEKISQAAARQRSGRCGRVSAGVCIRLFSEEDFNSRTEFTDPEIIRSNLAAVILRMAALKLGDVAAFPFLEMPDSRYINDGFQVLLELGAVNEHNGLTKLGEQMARLPIDPKIARILLAAKKHDCMAEILVIASALSIQDPRERPLEARDAAAKAHERFTDKQSDFLAYLNIWDSFQRERDKGLSNKQLVQWCRQYFLSHLRMCEWRELHHQLAQTAIEMGLTTKEAAFRRPPEVRQLTSSENAGDQDLSAKLKQKQLDKKQHRAQIRAAKEAGYEQIHRALLTGLIANVGMKSPDGNDYTGARGSRFHLFPASALFKAKPKWVMAAELVETTKLYARDVAAIQPEWIEQEALHLVRYHYFEPHWEQKRGEVVASERVTLYGLTVLPRRPVSYGRIAPEEAREIFIRSALVAQECDLKADFFAHNKKLIKEITELEHKSRKQDVLVDDEALFAFYNERLPDFYTADAVSDGLHTESSLPPRRLPENREPAGRTPETDKAETPSENGSGKFPQNNISGSLKAESSLPPQRLPESHTSQFSDSLHPVNPQPFSTVGEQSTAVSTVSGSLKSSTATFRIRPGTHNDAAQIAELFRRAVLHIEASHYSDSEKTAWIQGADNAAFWQKRIGRGCIRLAAQNDRILGFIEYLPEQNHLDCLFTDPAHQRQGVASALLSAVLPQADADKTVTADVSAAALPFFKKQGFILQHQNQIQRNGLVLINYRMILQTDSIDAAAQTNFSATAASPLPQEREQSTAASTVSGGLKTTSCEARLNFCEAKTKTESSLHSERLPENREPQFSDDLRPANPQQTTPSPAGEDWGEGKTVAAQTNFSATAASPLPNPLPQEREQGAGVSTVSDDSKAQRLPENSLCYADGQPILLGDRVTIDSKQWHGKIVALIAEQQCDPSIGSAEEWATLQSGVMAQFNEAGLVHYPDAETAGELILLARADAADVLKSKKHNVECVAHATHADSKDTDNRVREPNSHTLQNVSDGPKPKKQPAPPKGRLKPLPLADIRTFQAWLKTAERDNPRLLFLSRDDLMQHAAAHITEEQFPKHWQTADGKFKLSYRFEPHHPLDGVTLTLPLTVLNRISPAALEWLVPGMIREKIQLQIKALPKQIRRICVPVPEFITQFLSQNPDRNAPILPQLTQAIAKTAGDIRILEQINQDEWAAFRLPEHCYFNLRIIDDGGQELAMGRDLIQIQQQLGKAAATTFRDNTQEFERDNVTAWDIGTLPESIKFTRGKQQLTGYLGLQKEKDGRIALRLFDTSAAAEQAHRLGVIELMKLQLKEQVKDLNKGIQGFTQAAMLLKHINADTLRDDLTQAVCDRAFIGEDELPRNEKAFKEQIKRARSRLPAVKEALSRYLQETAAAYAELNGKLGKHPLTHLLRQRLQTLLAAGFATRTPWTQWSRLPVYIKAMTLRLEKYSSNPARDAAREADVQELEQMWQEKTDGLVKQGQPVSDDLAAFKWMIEELRVSLFAQELKTPYPVSVKRLLKVWEGLK